MHKITKPSPGHRNGGKNWIQNALGQSSSSIRGSRSSCRGVRKNPQQQPHSITLATAKPEERGREVKNCSSNHIEISKASGNFSNSKQIREVERHKNRINSSEPLPTLATLIKKGGRKHDPCQTAQKKP